MLDFLNELSTINDKLFEIVYKVMYHVDYIVDKYDDSEEAA